MANRFRLLGILVVALLTSAALAPGQSTSVAGGGVPNSRLRPAYQYAAAYQDEGSASRYVYAPTPKAQDSGQQQANGNQGQSQGGNQGQGMNGGQNQNPNQSQGQSQSQSQNQNQNNEGQKKEEEPPEKPHYLTYSVKKKSLDEQVKSGKALAVAFKSVPAGAVITVDGYFVGNTPTTAQIPLGKHLVSITKWGYDSWAQEIDVANGKDLSVNPTLHKDW